jgi:hypothetical protein
VAAAGAATVNFKLETDDAEDFSASVLLAFSGAIAKASLVAGFDAWRLALPIGAKRYGRLYYEVGTGPLTAGKFTAALVKDLDAWRAYRPSARGFA